MRKLSLVLGSVLLVACSGTPTAAIADLDGARPSFGGFGMGSGGRDGGSATDMTTASTMGGHTIGSGGREGGTVATDSTGALAGGTMGSGF